MQFHIIMHIMIHILTQFTEELLYPGSFLGSQFSTAQQHDPYVVLTPVPHLY